jgi:C4-type Zn-finger protein
MLRHLRPEHGGTAVTVLLSEITRRVQRFQSGDLQISAIEMDMQNGTEREVTVEGVLKNK